MFGILSDVVDIAVGTTEAVVTGAVNTVDDFVRDPVEQTIYHATSPVRNGLDVLEGLTEGEIRVIAAVKLGANVASGMAMSEILDALSD